MKKLSHSDLRAMSDRDLRSLARNLESAVQKTRRSNEKTNDLETEICYVQREIELRQIYHVSQDPRSNLKFETSL